ncbi:hypothetical protein MNBD_GAMMA10-331 [hydrothermal vent metagenome]|uniref:Uncharacterized protein n=1 Tax=hydrothermal vent metagenome TaxID=652676 RepID=A0A3B0YRY0_9ZZZZ
MRMYYPQEMQALFEFSGFKIEKAYGDYHCGELNRESVKQIYVLKKRPDVREFTKY